MVRLRHPGILSNPKYTGHMVWNRRSTRDKLHPGKNNRREEWIVSQEPAHPAIVSVELFSAAQGITKYRSGSPSEGAPPHPRARRTYPLRSFVRCELCDGRRMHGKCNPARTPYYYCQPRERDRPDGHPVTIWVREDEVFDGLNTFFNRHILGPDRLTLISRGLDDTAVRRAEDHSQRAAAVRRSIDDIQQRLHRLTAVLEERDDPGGAVFNRVHTRLADLEAQLRQRTTELARLEASAPPTSVVPVDLLAHLPQAEINFAALPLDRLRRLLDAFTVEISYNKPTHQLTYRAQISGRLIPSTSEMIIANARNRPNDDGTAHGHTDGLPRRGAPFRKHILSSQSRAADLGESLSAALLLCPAVTGENRGSAGVCAPSVAQPGD